MRAGGLGRSRRRRGAVIAAGAVAAGLGLVAIGCGEKQLVCEGPREHLALIASTSETDYDVSVKLAPEVSRRVVNRAARSCGALAVGIQDGRPDANLDLPQKLFKPRVDEAFGPGAVKEELVEEGEEFVARELLGPLGEAEPTGGSPFFATVAKTRREADARGWPSLTVVLIGDGFVVERSPATGRMVRFGQEDVSKQALVEFASMLGDLSGSCVMVVGFGANTELRGMRIRETESLLAEAFEAAGASFVATRSPSIRASCTGREKG